MTYYYERAMRSLEALRLRADARGEEAEGAMHIIAVLGVVRRWLEENQERTTGEFSRLEAAGQIIEAMVMANRATRGNDDPR